MNYRVELPVFSGPMDLLLHLVRQQEVDIHDVRIALVLDQYLAHVDVLEALDLSELGDFVVMASTLMEIKSKELLPREEVDLEQELSPKDDLIRRLLEYKRYRDISRRLAGMMKRRGQMVEPVVSVPKGLLNGDSEKGFDLGSIEIWDLTDAFARLLEETGIDKELSFDISRRTVDYYAGQILERVRGKEDINFMDLFDPSKGRYELIGVFSAMLEMMKQGYLRGHQDDANGEIRISFTGPDDATVDEILRGFDDELEEEPLESVPGTEPKEATD
jgi:segregation and condensation protein A